MKGLSFFKRLNPVSALIFGLIMASAWPVYSYMIKGSEVRLDASGFTKNLSVTDTTVQELADTVDQLTLGGEAYDKIEFVIDGRGQVITAGASGHKVVPWNCTVTSWQIVSTASGSAVVDIKKSTYAGYATFASIAGTEKPTISASTKGTDTSLTSFSTSLTKGDRVQALVDSADITGTVVLTLYVTKT